MTDSPDAGSEYEWWCPKHGYVDATEHQHGGRARAFVCPRAGCRRTVKSTTVDWDAYADARENAENPPCPRCESTAITTVPAKPTFRCSDCQHAFGYAGAYY
ncbi:hypothetical protein ACFQO4_20890 [Saliphagus sp. GCM10025334]